jgi:outer membrane protein OmpA-like peptidoglycan-associated protein
MRQILIGTTALAVALSGPLPVVAQTTITVKGQEVICLPNKKAECPDGAFCVVAKNDKNCRAKARDQLGATGGEDPALEPEAIEASPAESPEVIDTDQAEAEAAAEREAERVEAEEAARQAERQAKKAEEAAQAEAEQAAAEAEKAARQAERQAEKAAAEEAAQKETERLEAEQAQAEKEARQAEKAAQKAAEKAAEEAVQVEAETAEPVQVEAEATGGETADPAQPRKKKRKAEAVTEEQLITLIDPAEGVEAPTTEQVDVLTGILDEDPAGGAESPEAVVLPEAMTMAEPIVIEGGETPIVIGGDAGGKPVVVDADKGGAQGGETPAKKKKKKKPVVIDVTEKDVRKSDEDFAEKVIIGGETPIDGGETPVEKKSDKGLSDLEKFGLVVVGALVVGSILNNGNKVVSNTGDRVVVQQPDGQYVVLKDDDTLIRRPGSNVQTETFDDGSTRSVVTYADGSRIVTIRDASGRVLRRSRYDAAGNEVRLIDDTVPVERIDVSTLPKPGPGRVIGGQDAELAAAMAALEADDVGRRFSLRQIREYPQVRALAPELNVERVTFDTGSAAIRGSEAQKLRELGLLMADLIRKNPAEVFLIEGHTDAVGNAGYNLSLSDRRAESLALALTEYFGVPPENMVVQGYGESELLVQSAGDESRNRRTAVRLITGLLTRAD